MSQVPFGRRGIDRRPPSRVDGTEVLAGEDAQPVLEALQDEDCRAILAVTGERALSASEIAATLDLPVSTTYRKLDVLAAADLIEERTRVRPSGKHPSEYVRRIDDVVVSLGALDRTTVTLVTPRAAGTPSPRSR